MWAQQQINLPAFSRGFHIITSYVIDSVPEIKNQSIGMLHLFIKHTSASIAINEGADPDVRVDFETHFNFMVPETANHFLHTLEGSDDMTSHIKSSLLGSSLDIPIKNGSLLLGTWQGIYLCEHRNKAGSRRIVITVNGDE